MALSGFTLHWADYVIFFVTICISLGIGIYQALAGTKQKTTSEYLVGGRRMSCLPVALSFAVTFMSSIFFLGNPAEMYTRGIHFQFLYFGNAVANVLAVIFTIPLFHHLQITSAYEYLEMRYQSVAVRKMGSCFGISANVIYMAVVMFGPAVALNAAGSFPTWLCLLLIGFAAIIYTSVGGLKAVVWTDVFQAVVMISGLLAIVGKAVYEVGGFARFWKLNLEAGRLNVNFSFDPTIARTFWACLIGGSMKRFSYTFNQSSILRYVSIPSLKEARKMLLVSTPVVIVLSLMSCMGGLGAFAYYTNKRCDPFEDGRISNSNQILPFFLMDLFQNTPGVPGLIFASLLSACLSTLSSGLSSISACALTDFVRPIFPHISEIRATKVAKILVVIFGCVAIGLSFLIMQIKGTIGQIATSFVGAVEGPTAGMFILGGLVPYANKYGALVGGITGIIVTMYAALSNSLSKKKAPWLPPAPTSGCAVNTSASEMLSNNFTLPLFRNLTGVVENTTVLYQSNPYSDDQDTQPRALSFMYHTFLGMLVSFSVGVLVSFLTGRMDPKDVDPAHVSYLVRRFFYDDSLSKSGGKMVKSNVEEDPLMLNGTDADEVKVQPQTMKDDGV